MEIEEGKTYDLKDSIPLGADGNLDGAMEAGLERARVVEVLGDRVTYETLDADDQPVHDPFYGPLSTGQLNGSKERFKELFEEAIMPGEVYKFKVDADAAGDERLQYAIEAGLSSVRVAHIRGIVVCTCWDNEGKMIPSDSDPRATSPYALYLEKKDFRKMFEKEV